MRSSLVFIKESLSIYTRGAKPVIRESNVILFLKNMIREAFCCFFFLYTIIFEKSIFTYFIVNTIIIEYS